MSAKNLSVAEVLTRATDRVDSGMYFDTAQASANVGVPRIFVPRYRLMFIDHFLGDSLGALWTTSTQNSPTGVVIRDEKNGVARLTIAATSEAETLELNFGDLLQFDADSGIVLEVGFRPVAAYTTNHKAYIGLGTARNNTYTSIARRVGFAISETMDLQTDSDDATTDTGLIDSTQNLTAGLWHYGRIEFVNKNDVRIYAGASVPIRINSGTTFKTGSVNLQPILSSQKASGTGVPSLDLDYVALYART